MHHYFEAITNNKGDALTGYYVRLVDSGGSGVTLYADTSLTPIVSVSGVADAAKVDANGNVDFYVAVGTYTLNIYATDSTTLVATIRDVGMNIDMDTAATAVAAQAAASASATAAASSAATALTAYTSIASTANATAHAATRTALDLLPSTVGPVWLREDGYQGMWEYKAGNYAARVTADTRGGVFRALPDVATSAGARVRAFSGPINIQWFGGVADAIASGTGTSNTAALDCAAAVGALLGRSVEILFPAALGHYRFSTAPADFTNTVKIIGQGHGENPGTVNGVTYAAPQNYRGSVLRFDADVKGLTFSAYTDNNADATALEFQGSSRSVLRDLLILGLGGTGLTSHGIDAYAIVNAHNVRVLGFAGNGLNLNANTAGSNRYGNTDLSQFYGCKFDQNKLHGAYLDGNDDNVVNFLGCSFSDNGGCGSLDTTTVGNNIFYGCHYTSNNRSHPTNSASGYSAGQIAKVQADAPMLTDNMAGSAVTYRSKIYDNSDIGNSSGYICCYVETGTGAIARLKSPTYVAGGLLPQSANRHSQWTAQTFNGTEIRNVSNYYGDTGGTITFNDCALKLTRSDSSIPKFTIAPSATATFSQIAMQGANGSAANGLDILAGSAAASFSADTITLRNAAQTTNFLASSATGVLASVPLGYKTGAGGAVTQITSRTTGVTLNTVCGQITLFSAAGSATWQTFTVTNSKVAATDVIRLSQSSGTDLYMIHVTNVAAGSFKVSFATTGGTTTEAPVLNFAVIKSVAA